MAFKSQTGKSYGSKFRANRADKAAKDGMEKSPAPDASKGKRAEANAIEGKGETAQHANAPAKAPSAPGAGDGGGPVNAPASGTMAAKASEVHITHDHANNVHHVHARMSDGTEMHSDHASPEEAHFAGAQAAGADGNYPQEHEAPEGKEAPDQDDYDVEPLD
jgi:hypothetical protein